MSQPGLTRALRLLPMLLGGLSACAIEPFAGGRLAELPAQPEISYRVVDCVITNSQKRVRLKAPIWYHVGADAAGPLVFEQASSGQVVAITNRWTDGRASHSLVWVYGGPYGYHIVRPWSASQPAERLLWRRRDLQEVGGVWKPKPRAVPYARCAMERRSPTKGRPVTRPAQPPPRPR